MSLFRRDPPLGTPENPEVIEPGENPRGPKPPPGAGFFAAVQILKTMFAVALPAVLIDWIGIGLFGVARQPDGIWAWIALIFVIPPAFLLTLFAVVVVSVLSVVLVLTLMGRSVRIPTSGAHFVHFGRKPPRY